MSIILKLKEIIDFEVDHKIASENDIKNWNEVKKRLQKIILLQAEVYDLFKSDYELSIDILYEKMNLKQFKLKQEFIYNLLYEIYIETLTIFNFNAAGIKTETAQFWEPVSIKLNECF